MVQYFGGFEEEEEDPVLFELDVYLNNATFSDVLGKVEDLSDSISVLKELSAKPFERLFLLQYPLELYNYRSDTSPDGTSRNLVNSNSSDRLVLKSLEIGEQISNSEVVTKKTYGSQANKLDKHKTSPLVRLNYDLGELYLPKAKSSPVKKSHKPTFLVKQELDFKSSPIFAPLNHELRSDNVLTFDSMVSSSDHITDCLGLLKVEEGEDGLKRELHLLPVKSILQLRPKLDSFNQNIISVDDNLMDLFHNNNLNWKSVDKIFFSDSNESKELVDLFGRYGKEIAGVENSVINFKPEKDLYVNSLCIQLNSTGSTFQKNSTSSIENLDLNSTKIYTKMHDRTPNLRFMKRLNVETQLKLLLSHRFIDSFYSLKRDIVQKKVDDLELIQILSKFAKNIDGNWVLSSEHAIENYTEEDELTQDEKEYLVGCRDLMLSLLNRQARQPTMLRTNTSVGQLASERFQNATGLPLKIVNQILSTVAKRHGKFWCVKLTRDDEFCLRYPQVVQSFQKYWNERINRSANIIQSFKMNSKVNQMVRNIFIRAELVGFIKNRIYTHKMIMDHLESLGYSKQQDNIDKILSQVATQIYNGLWTCKKNNAWLTKIKNDLGNSIDNDIPNFIIRRINKFTY